MFMHILAQLTFGFFVAGMFVVWLVGALTILDVWHANRRDKRIFKNVNKFRQDFK